jgi:hypothetical protein
MSSNPAPPKYFFKEIPAHHVARSTLFHPWSLYKQSNTCYTPFFESLKLCYILELECLHDSPESYWKTDQWISNILFANILFTLSQNCHIKPILHDSIEKSWNCLLVSPACPSPFGTTMQSAQVSWAFFCRAPHRSMWCPFDILLSWNQYEVHHITIHGLWSVWMSVDAEGSPQAELQKD